MNSDPHESAAWRTYGMLDTDETASFDEAMRQDPTLRKAFREMDCLSAAVAAATTQPLAPRAGQLERLHARLGLNATKPVNWLGITGWAAAAVLTAILILQNPPQVDQQTADLQSKEVPNVIAKASSKPEEIQIPNTSELPSKTVIPSLDASGLASTQEVETKSIAKAESKRLIQEIEVLREKLEHVADRDRRRFAPVTGMAWPIIMTMNPPELTASETIEPPMLTTLLGDALIGRPVAMNASSLAETAVTSRIPNTRFESIVSPESRPVVASNAQPAAASPSGVPIYDPARDLGTLVVNNLKLASPDESYNLWVTTEDREQPILVGRLPDTMADGADSFDFSLGSTAVLPTGFYLTKDPRNTSRAPTDNNTILKGPR